MTKEAKPTDTTNEALHVKYRPVDWDDVVGQDAAVKVMRRMIEQRKSQTFLLVGPSGCGKTTLARIAAKALGCGTSGAIEIDAATNSGVDYVRSIQEMARYRALDGNGNRALTIDECHGLSRQSWDALLKVIEEPPPHMVWFLCTTNPAKVPQTIKTRCTVIQLREVKGDDLFELLDRVCEAEKMDPRDDVADQVIKSANGSPRQMLVNLEICRDAKTRKEAIKLLSLAEQSDGTLELCRFLVRPQGSWKKIMSIIAKIDDTNYEGTRIQVSNYFGKVCAGAVSDRDAVHALKVIDAFSRPYNQSEGIAPLLLSVGRIVFDD